ncbi:S-crystallin SL11-like [Ostrea edulis]|uniref:S-crystallin SL11-like n=1 Tax=Ostrea edulis TaxID=37623 RepID=UPI0024AFCE4C|nr:S-crystallin SL11-like [Ostrea edulis]
MPAYKLYYFNAKGRAEVCRLLFAAAGAKYEDIRIEGTEWPKKKPSMPQGSMPVLEVDGKMIPQSRAIERFLAREFGLYGKTNMDAANIDVVCETVTDFFQALFPAVFGSDEAVKAEKMKAFKEFVPVYMQRIEDCLKKNAGGKGFLVGSNLTMADLAFLRTLDAFDKMELKLTDTLTALRKRIEAAPKIGAYLKSRPVTEN